MNKIHTLFIVALGCFLLAACSDDSFTEKVSSVKVTSATTVIGASGGSGKIVVNTPSKISAYSADAWLKVETSADTVIVSADINTSLSTRNTTVVVKSGVDSTVVNVSQYGMVVALSSSGVVSFGDAASSQRLRLKKNVPVKFSSNADWITCDVSNDSLQVTTTQNSTGNPRAAYLKYTYGSSSDSIKVVQGEISDIAGEWSLVGTNPSSSQEEAYDVNITPNASGDSLNIDLSGFILHAAYTNNQIVLNGGDYIGTYGPYYMYLCMYDSNAGYLSWNTSVTYAADFSQEGAYHVYSFDDTGSWSGYSVNGLKLGASSTSPSITYLGSILSLTDVYLYR
jgi:hypothetical protein